MQFNCFQVLPGRLNKVRYRSAGRCKKRIKRLFGSIMGMYRSFQSIWAAFPKFRSESKAATMAMATASASVILHRGSTFDYEAASKRTRLLQVGCPSVPPLSFGLITENVTRYLWTSRITLPRWQPPWINYFIWLGKHLYEICPSIKNRINMIRNFFSRKS